jgi:hypothetical protein
LLAQHASNARCTRLSLGADATRAFRAWEQDNLPPDAPRLPVFCITANVLEEHRLVRVSAVFFC